LFITPRFTLRDAVELAQRLDLDFDTAPVWDAHHLGYDPAVPEHVPGASADETVARLRRRLKKDYDLIVLGNLDLSILPEDILSAVAEKVARGAGLLLAHRRAAYSGDSILNSVGSENQDQRPRATELSILSPEYALVPVEDTSAITRGIGEDMTPEWFKGLDFVTASTFELGRVVELAYPGEPPKTHCLLPVLTQPLLARPEFMDTYFSLLAKAARWAAGREPLVWIERLEFTGPTGPDEEEIPPDFPEEYIQAMRDAVVPQPYRPYRLVLNQPADRAFRVEAQVREPGRGLREVYSYDAILSAGQSTYPIQVAMGPGRYFVDTWLFDHNAIVDWHTEVITVEGWPEFTGLKFSKAALLANDTLDVSLDVRPLLHQPRASMAYVRATDALKRLVAESYQIVPADGGEVHLRLNFADLIAGMVKVDVFVVDGTHPPFTHRDTQRAAHGSAYLPVRRTAPANAFSFLVSSPIDTEYNVRLFLKTFAELGVDTVHAPATAASRFSLDEVNLYPLPELTRYTCDTAVEGTVRAPCLSDPVFREEETVRLQEGAVLFWAGGSGMYSLGDGNQLIASEENVCQSPSCLEGFQETLRARYETLGALNAACGTGFASWAAVRPATEAEAATSGKFAPWIDFRRYMDTVFAGIHVHGREVIRGVDRHGRVGFRAAHGLTPYQGYDWWRLASQLDVLGVAADDLTMEKIRSYCDPHCYAAVCVGDGFVLRTIESAQWLPWRLVLHQVPAFWWTTPTGSAESATPYGALMPDGRPAPLFAAAAHEIADLKASGLDALLLRAMRKNSGIAIYASQSSFLLNLVEPSFGCDSLCAEARFARLLENLGYQYDFVSSEQVERGRLGGYSVLVLPMARALGDAEIAAVREFHALGGHLIADVASGQFDEHGIPRAQPPLAGLFGVRYGKPVQAGEPAEAQIELALGEGHPDIRGRLSGVRPDTSLEPAGADVGGAAGGSPVWLVGDSGPGLTVLINHALPAYTGYGAGSNERNLRALMGALLERAGATPLVRLAPPEGKAFRIECFGFRYDKADILALLSDPKVDGKRQKVTLSFGPERCVYDMRHGQRVRRAKKVRVRLVPGEAKLYSSLPYEVNEVRVDVPETVPCGRRLPVYISVKTEGGLPGEHLVRIEIAPVSGKPMAHYAQNVVCHEGQGDAFMPLALNEALGLYTITVRDVLTGMSAHAAVRLTPKL